MSSEERASFYSRDPTPYTSDSTDTGKKKYMGEERRRENRRKQEDRRDEVRFDTKGDRRQEQGRRETDKAPKFW